MSIVRSLCTATRAELRGRITSGFAIDPRAIEGYAYRGTSLGLPGALERLSWKTFQKTFWRHPSSGRLLGWNVRLEQDGIDAPSRPKRRDGEPVTEWFYEVVTPDAAPMPAGFDRGLVIDYGRAPNPRSSPMRWVKDPLVALVPGDADLLLGVSFAVLGGFTLATPTYFSLEREHPVDFVPEVMRR